jgi:hypothetical protein
LIVRCFDLKALTPKFTCHPASTQLSDLSLSQSEVQFAVWPLFHFKAWQDLAFNSLRKLLRLPDDQAQLRVHHWGWNPDIKATTFEIRSIGSDKTQQEPGLQVVLAALASSGS